MFVHDPINMPKMTELKSITVSYGGGAPLEMAYMYCPYVPLVMPYYTKIDPLLDKLTYKFYTHTNINSEAIDWLINHCNWKYFLISMINESYQTYVAFEDVQGSVEFKLRFIDT